ncbi:MAG: hypothetical protein GXP10_01700 [Gammaproteobacteria bacterium]|nr:hypothetical protein [Gammaproteobacteria bacterium]
MSIDTVDEMLVNLDITDEEQKSLLPADGESKRIRAAKIRRLLERRRDMKQLRERLTDTFDYIDVG